MPNSSASMKDIVWIGQQMQTLETRLIEFTAADTIEADLHLAIELEKEI